MLIQKRLLLTAGVVKAVPRRLSMRELLRESKGLFVIKLVVYLILFTFPIAAMMQWYLIHNLWIAVPLAILTVGMITVLDMWATPQPFTFEEIDALNAKALAQLHVAP